MNIEQRIATGTTSIRTEQSSLWKATFNATNAFLGIGIVAVPFALSRGGWLTLILCVVIALMTCYTSMLLKACMDADSSIKSYLDIIERAFGKSAGIIASVIVNMELYLVAVSLVIAESDNLHKLFPALAINIGSGALVIGGRKTFVLLTALITFPTILLTDLSLSSYLSAAGVICSLLIVGSLVSVGISVVGFHAPGGQLWDMSGIPTTVSFYIFCFAGHPILPSIYMSMRRRHDFSKVLLISFLLTTITYVATAITGYLMYGEGVNSQITLNLPTAAASSKIAIYATLLIPVTRYALMMTSVAAGIESISNNASYF